MITLQALTNTKLTLYSLSKQFATLPKHLVRILKTYPLNFSSVMDTTQHDFVSGSYQVSSGYFTE